MDSLSFTTGGRHKGVIYLYPTSGATDNDRIDSKETTISTTEPSIDVFKHDDGDTDLLPHLTQDAAASTLLCLMQVPSYMIPADLVRYISGLAHCILGIRVLRRFDSESSHTSHRTEEDYCALLRLSSPAATHIVIDSFSNKPFSSLDPTLCILRIVRTISFPPALSRDFSSMSLSSHGADYSLTDDDFIMQEGLCAEFCTVCLEPLRGSDLSTVAGRGETLFTTYCCHSFHAECISRLESSACPVCRFQHDSPDATLSECAVCRWRGDGAGVDDDLWVCVVCGFVGCGARREDHIKAHYCDTLHTYSVNTCTNAVYDFAGGGFVHRLILQRSDSLSEAEAAGTPAKIVEVANPMGEMEADMNKLCRSSIPSLSSRREEVLINKRLESAAYVHNQEMAWRLDRHRQALEVRLQRHRSFIAHESSVGSGEGSWASRAKQHLLAEKSKLQRQLEASSTRLQTAKKEADVLCQLRESLSMNNVHWRERLSEVQRGLMEEEKYSRTVLPPLENKVRELMARLDVKNGEETKV